MTTINVESRLRSIGRPIINALANGCIVSGLTANHLTLFGMLFSLLACIYMMSSMFMAGIMLLIGGTCDALDGAVARQTNTVTRSGAFMDSVFDRVSDMAPQLMLLVTATKMHFDLLMWLCFGTLVVSSLIPYVKAKGESLGTKVDLGIMPRAARFILFEVGLLTTPQVMVLMLATIFLGGLITVIQRYRQCVSQLTT